MMRFLLAGLLVFCIGCGGERNDEGVLRLSWNMGLYRLERGVYNAVIIRPTSIDLVRVDGAGVDRLWNDMSRQSADNRTEITRARQRAQQKGYPVELRYNE